MPNFSFSNIDHTPSKPTGENEYVFRLAGSDDTLVVEANGPRSAWEGIRYYKGPTWEEWILQGRKDLVDGGHVHPMVSADFRKGYPAIAKQWDESDSPEE